MLGALQHQNFRSLECLRSGANNFFEPQSDGEEPTSPVAADESEQATGGEGAGGGGSSQMTVLEALKGVLKLALIHDGLARGLREASKALDRRQAHMCVLNEGCEEEAYKKLVVALCGEHGIPLIKVPDGKMLGEWAGLCEYNPLAEPVPRVLFAHDRHRHTRSRRKRPKSGQLFLRGSQGLG